MTTIAHSVGKTVGVVHDSEFAVGIQCLNPKTIGGWPPELPFFDYAKKEFPEARFPYEMCAAWPAREGSRLLQAYVRNRTKDTRRMVWNMPDIPVAAIHGADAEIAGTKIALFGCEVSQVLETIEAIEIGEGLPHPRIEGE
ncbi:hypothetical protein Elgi_32390 [Paenibacillus elgii]|uniref:hypothetical protein n=1 Tax=Paenibacillus elgii TaxID=189691 RepID=UPI002D7A5D08|nr:hypothetical protein Elgi_32390 [Paenibacillus elgii]